MENEKNMLYWVVHDKNKDFFVLKIILKVFMEKEQKLSRLLAS